LVNEIMTESTKLEVPIQGMDCAECTRHVHEAISALPGVDTVEVYLAAEKAVVILDPQLVDMSDIRQAVKNAGYAVPDPVQPVETEDIDHGLKSLQNLSRPVLGLFGIVFGLVLFVVVFGEWLGLFETFIDQVPWWIWFLLVLLAGWPVFIKVIRAAQRGKIIAHTLMTAGVIAAIAVGEWATAVVVAFFMRIGDYAERFTTERARKAVRDLNTLAPQHARILRQGSEVEIPVDQVEVGDTVIIRPGEKIPVDGQVLSGKATIDQSMITGESMPADVVEEDKVFAATIIQLGSLRVRAEKVGESTVFGRVIKLVEEAEGNRADIERVADRFASWYLPVVLSVAVLTLLLRRDPLAAAAVLVVACSCAFALATPIAMLASIGAGARQGFLIKGGHYLELLEKAEIVLVDKTGTLTMGKPHIIDTWCADDMDVQSLLRFAASAERYSEHPLAEAVRSAARQAGIDPVDPTSFESFPGWGVRATVDGHLVEVGSHRSLAGSDFTRLDDQAEKLSNEGKTLLFIQVDGRMAGLLAAVDILRSDVPEALKALQKFGVKKIELLTGDNERTAESLVDEIGLTPPMTFKANMLPEDKISVVRQYQSQGFKVVMIGDGVNDAPALAQADVGIAMGAAGSDIAIEAAHISLMRQDWSLVPELFSIAHRTMRVVRGNIIFTAIYNLLGLSLAAFGFLPPILAAGLQAAPDLIILGNSSRLLYHKNG
jgi:Cu+-exporting ATPase